MRQKLNLTELSKVEMTAVTGAVSKCSDGCKGDISYFAEDIGSACDCGSIFMSIGMNLGEPIE